MRILFALLSAAVAFCVAVAFWPDRGIAPGVNPDPNHTHADFAVWIDGKEVDFAQDKYMSGASTDANHDQEIGNRKYLHLHDGIGHVIHRHKPGLTLAQFFETIGVTFRKNGLNLCMAIDGKESCENEAAHRNWIMTVNGIKQPFLDTEYVFEDGDHLLLLLPQTDTEAGQNSEISEALGVMTDDACLYSRTCPERGEPPAENCIADPEVPCVVQ